MEVIIGLDINEFQVQVSYVLQEEKPSVKTLLLSGKGEGMVVETAICRRHGVNQWYYGVDAIKKAKNAQGVLIENLWRKFLQEREVMIEDTQYDTALLCNLFLKRILDAAIVRIKEEVQQEIKLQALVITAEPFPKEQMERMDIVLGGLSVDRGNIYLQTHEESLFSYLVHQPERMLGYETGVLDLTNETLISYRIEMNHRTKPVTVIIDREEVSGMIRRKHYPSITEHDSALIRLDGQLGNYATEFTRDRLVTTFYLVGDGFDGDWCRESLKILCRNRKVYAGNNLYSKGAAYSGLEKICHTETALRYVFLGKGMLKDNIGIMVSTGEAEEYCPLLDAGTNWYEAQNEIELMLERADELALLITPVTGQHPYEERISLAVLDQREEGTYRIRLALRMQSETTLTVEVTDEGFGELFPPSKMTVMQTIELEGGR